MAKKRTPTPKYMASRMLLRAFLALENTPREDMADLFGSAVSDKKREKVAAQLNKIVKTVRGRAEKAIASFENPKPRGNAKPPSRKKTTVTTDDGQEI